MKFKLQQSALGFRRVAKECQDGCVNSIPKGVMKFIKRTLISEISSAGNFLGDYNSVFPQWPHLTTRWAKREDQYFCRDSNICASLRCNGQLLHTKAYVNSMWNQEGNDPWILTENRSTMAFQDDVFPGTFCMLSHNWGLSHRMWEIEPKALSVFHTQFPLPNDRNISVAVFMRTLQGDSVPEWHGKQSLPLPQGLQMKGW